MDLKNDSIIEQDLILIYIENRPAFFGRVEKITPDVKPKWWSIKFLALTLPLKIMTWIIDDEQIRGADFTMGGTPIRIEKVIPPEELDVPSEETKITAESEDVVLQKKARVLSLHIKKKEK